MWSGINTLDKIDSTLHSLRSEAINVDQQLAGLSQRYAAVEQRRLALVHEIAKVRLAGIESGELDNNLSTADREVKSLLAQREDSLTALNAQIEAATTITQEIEKTRLEQLGRVNDVSQSIADTQAQVQAALLEDQEYLAQLAVASKADSIALESKQKVDVAKADMAEKAVPYQADELFKYLWDRGYGTTDYEAGLIARWLDGKVAKLIGFEAARVNYWNLTQIPKRLEQHAQNVAEQAEIEAQAVEKFEADRLREAGFDQLNAKLSTLRDTLDELDDQLEAQESELNQLLESRAAYLAGEDSLSRQCLSRLAQAMDHRDLEAVYRYVLETSSFSDDELVVELSDVDQQARSLKDDSKDLKKLYQRQLDRLKDIEGVRRNFKNARFDDARSKIDNQELVAAALGQFVQGLMSGSDLWGVIKRNQRYTSTRSSKGGPDLGPGFGSDGLRRRSRRSASRRAERSSSSGGSRYWPTPRKKGGRIRPRAGSASRSRSKGGFKTGGSF